MKRKLRAMQHGAGAEEGRCGAASDPGLGKAARSSLAARDETQAWGPGSHSRINRKLPDTSFLKPWLPARGVRGARVLAPGRRAG